VLPIQIWYFNTDKGTPDKTVNHRCNLAIVITGIIIIIIIIIMTILFLAFLLACQREACRPSTAHCLSNIRANYN